MFNSKVYEKYEAYNHRDCASILMGVEHIREIQEVLLSLLIEKNTIVTGGGGKSLIASHFDKLYPYGWTEQKFNVEITDGVFFETHKIDFVKKRIALEIEWNNKDTFFDRDLNAFRVLFEHGIIDGAIIVTRSSGLQKTFKRMVERDGLSKDKFVSTTTHMDRLIPRLLSGASGDCPILALGITNFHIIDNKTNPSDEYFIFS